MKALWGLKQFSDQEVKNHYGSFVSLLEQHVNSKTQSALQALGEKPIECVWPRLNDPNSPINYGSDSFPGRELIARIYQFILDEPSEQRENLMQSLVNALDDAKDVCHPGKAQRIAVAILQGSQQLPNVDIDGMNTKNSDEEKVKAAVTLLVNRQDVGGVLAEYPLADDETDPKLSDLKSELCKAISSFLLEELRNIDKSLFITEFNRINYLTDDHERRLTVEDLLEG